MKIAILSNNTGSLYHQRLALLNTLVQAGHRVVLISAWGPYAQQLQQIGCTISPLEVKRRQKNPLADIILCYRYYKLLRQIRPNVVLSYHIKPNIYGAFACQLLKIPYLPNITGLGTALEYPGKLQKLTALLYKLAMRKAHTLFFQNKENQSFFETKGLIGKQSHTVLLPGSGVDLDTYTPLPYPPQGITHFLFVSRILKEKGIDMYLAAARKFAAPDVQFHICGSFDTPAYEAVIQHAVKQGIVHYHGRQAELKPFFRQCACLLHPSWYPEGMSNVLLEAAASARPAITTNRAGCRETVTDGQTGFIVPVQDETAFLQAVEKFLALPWEQRRQMGLKARAKVEKEFDRQRVVDAYLKELETINYEKNC